MGIQILQKKNPEYEYRDGVFYPHENVIVIYDHGLNNGVSAMQSLLHEIGHVIDYYLGSRQIKEMSISTLAEYDYYSYLSRSDKMFIEVFNEEYKNSFLGDYFSDRREYFAETFALYFLDNEFKYLCPKTVGYMENLLKKLPSFV